MSAIDDFIKFVKSLRECENKYRQNYQTVNDCDNEVCDIEHELELAQESNLPAKRIRFLGNEIRRVKQLRRVCKLENQQLEFIHQYLLSNQNLINELEKVVNSIEKEMQKSKELKYTPKVRDDLTISTKEVKTMNTVSNAIPKNEFESMMKEFKSSGIAKRKGS